MRKPLIHTHCHLICCVYIKGCMSIHIVWCWRCWDTWIQEIKAMLKVLKIFYKFQCIECCVCQRHQRWCLQLLCNTACRVLLLILLMSKVSKMSNTMYCTLYTGPLVPLRGKPICYLKSLLSCVKLQGWLQARHTANPQFLKLRGCSATW